jgi:RND family efflux transporter MFP subunit
MFRLPCALLSVMFIVPGMVGFVGAETVSATAKATGQKKTLNLHFVRAKRLSVQMPIVGTGTIFAHKSSKIGPLVEGQVVRVHVNVGDRVEKDGPLFEIRPENYQSAYEEAEARLAMAEAKVSDVKPAYERAKQLYGRRTTSKAQLDRATSSLAVVHSEIALAKAGIKRAKQDLRDTVVRSPFKGVVTSRYLDEGVFLSPRIPGGNSAVIEVQKIDVVVAIIQVPARVLEKLFVGARAKLKIDGITNAVEAMVTIINDKVNIATRSVEVRIAVLNGSNAIKPGLFVRAQIYPKSRDVVVIPRHTVKGPKGQRLVYVLEHGTAVRKQVRTVDHDATRVQVLSGLAEGDRVLLGPDLPHVSDGLQVGEVNDVAG